MNEPYWIVKTGLGKRQFLTLFFTILILSFCEVNGQSDSPAAKINFSNDIQPILAEKCFQCHGPDEKSRKADLRLDTKEAAFQDLGGYSPIVQGDSEHSEIVERIFHDDPDSVMPPPKFQAQLSASEKELIVQWIDQGANWENHWAFEKPTPTELPPTLGQTHPIDHFILKKHREMGFVTNPEADRYALARRAALDITGLPPTPQELDLFLKDKSPDAYLTYIDQQLASNHYGEHRARFWLDAARYGDTHGLHLDNFREMWPYRDWVINAFNRNQPYDQFAIEQLAGDLLPNPTKTQLIATGFMRNNASSSEAGSIPEELKVRYMNDRTKTMSAVFLGLTTGCAACHDHKFDPISQKEFYQLGAFFNNSADPPMDGNMRDTYPVIVVPAPEEESAWNQICHAQDQLLEKLKKTTDTEVEKWWTAVETNQLLNVHPLPDEHLAVYAPLDDIELGHTNVMVNRKSVTVPTPGAEPAKAHPHGNRGLRFTESGGLDIPVGTLFQPDQPVTVSMWIRTPDDVKGLMLMSQWGEENEEQQLKKTGWNIELIPDGAFEMPLRDHEGTLCNTLMPSETPVLPKTWQHVAIRYSGGQAASSITYFINGEWRVGRRNSDTKISDRFGQHISDVLTLGPGAEGGGISDFRIYTRWLLDDELILLANEFTWNELSAKKPNWDQLSDHEKALVKRYYQSNADTDLAEVAPQISQLKNRSDYLYARSPTTLVMKEKDTPAQAHVLIRGEYDNRGSTVSANTPAVLPKLNAEGSANRLDLAWWLFDRKNPLTARVTVNQIWQSFFGTGLVKTSEDFGVMGEKPTHPELLDWLAADFESSGWDVKRLIRQIVTSATYRQASLVRPETFAKDPENRYLARGPRRRLDAEVLRDQALAVTGILDRSFGGPSVKPYQPTGVWQTVAFQVSNTNRFELDNVDKLHRRSIYTFWKKTAIPPAFAAFDAPSREECAVRRERTNTPLQALVLMNDEQHIEAARKLAEDLLSNKPNQTDPERAREAFLKVVGRPAKAADIIDLLELESFVRKQYIEHPEESRSLITVGKLPINEALDSISVASWTVVINALLNRDDVINQS